MPLVAYVAKDDLVGYQWEKSPLGIVKIICPPPRRAPRRPRRGGAAPPPRAAPPPAMGDFWDGIWNVNEKISNKKSGWVYME